MANNLIWTYKKPKAALRLVWPPILAILINAVAAGAVAAQERIPDVSLKYPRETRRMTLEQVKQQVAGASNPLARLGQLSVEKARQHRLGVQADYFPKFSAGFINLHYSDFLGRVVGFQRLGGKHPLEFLGKSGEGFAVPLFSQNQTAVNVSLIQPITPLLQVHQAMKIARADERIAEAKAAAPIAANAANVEETYYKLLIAQRRLTYGEWNLRNVERSVAHEPPADAAPIVSVSLTVSELEPREPMGAQKQVATAGTEVRELTASLDRLMGLPDDTPLELVPPDPLVENISLREIADTAVPAASPEVVEAEQNVVKARAASTLAKLEYVPTVAAVGGFLFQNVIPLVPSNLGYGGAMVTYNLFDFGKRKHAVTEARIQLEMAQIALQLTKAKVAAKLKESYFELERSRQISLMAQKMGSSAIRLAEVSSTLASAEAKAARAQVEAEIFEAELAHRQAYVRLKALMGAK
jgi:outer membrane protein TolC